MTVPSDPPASVTPAAFKTWAQNVSDTVQALEGATSLQLAEVGWYSSPAGPRSATVRPEARVEYTALLLNKTQAVDRIGIEVTSAGTAGAVVRLGIYESNADGFPATLLVDAGTIDGTSATFQEITIAETLTPGAWWLAAVIQGAASTRPTIRCIANTNTPPFFASNTGASATAGNVAGIYSASVTGALPASPTIVGTTGFTFATVVRFA